MILHGIHSMCSAWCLHIRISTCYFYVDVTQDPTSGTYCEGSNVVLRCVIFDNTTLGGANSTGWFINSNPPVSVPNNFMITNTRDGDVVTSVLTIENVPLDINNIGYFCSPAFNIGSDLAVISVTGEYT